MEGWGFEQARGERSDCRGERLGVCRLMTTQTILGWTWALMGVYWLLSALRTKKTEINEAQGWRIMRLSLLCVVFTLLLTDRLRIGFLGWRFVPEYSWNQWIGIALTLAGPAIYVLVRHHLVEDWRDTIWL